MPGNIIAQKQQGNNVIFWEQQKDGTIDQVLYDTKEGLKELDRKKNVETPYNPAVPFGYVPPKESSKMEKDSTIGFTELIRLNEKKSPLAPGNEEETMQRWLEMLKKDPSIGRYLYAPPFFKELIPQWYRFHDYDIYKNKDKEASLWLKLLENKV